MGAFDYKAIDKNGRETRGLIEGDTARQVRQLLRERGLLPVDVSEITQEGPRRVRRIGVSKSITANDLALVTRQLATLVRSGLPLEESLKAVSEQNDRPKVQSILMGVRSKVMEGHTLASGFADFPHAFPEIYRATVAAGEQSGHLDEILERLADYTENRQVTRQKVRGALVYPIILTVFSILIVSFLLAFVVPKVVDVYASSGQILPLMTRILISSSDFVVAWWPLLLLGILGAFFGLRAYLNQPGPKRSFHLLQLRLPLIGKLVQGLNTARLTRTLSILAASGVPVLDSFRIAGEVVNNIPMKEAVEAAAARVREGAAIGRSLAVSKLFPPMTLHLISSGEASGKLEVMLERAAINQEREMDSIIGALLNTLQPLLTILMGVVVLFIVMAMLMPLFQFNQLIG
ncbi:MAG: type II secretion system inner membrane protein GspF [Chromatiales bacterium]|nr:type II secretion system inner membrane protein GspF [Chromatiales bacterium]